MNIEELRQSENEVSYHMKRRAEVEDRLQLAISSLAMIVVMAQKEETTKKEIMIEAHQGIMKAKGVVK